MTGKMSKDMDDDAISLTSTVASEYEDEEQFDVIRILAEKVQSSKRVYLILWENYPVEKATWEPKSHINLVILDAWKERKLREQKGIDEPFDVSGWEANIKSLAKAKALRKKRRKAKRKHLGIPILSSDSDIPMADRGDESSDEAIEDNEVNNDMVTKDGKRKGVALVMERKKKFSDTSTQSASRSSRPSTSDNTDDEKARRLEFKGGQEKKQMPSLVKQSKSKNTQNTEPHRELSDSSSDEPLFLKSRQESNIAGTKGPQLDADTPKMSRAGARSPTKRLTNTSKSISTSVSSVAPLVPSTSGFSNSLSELDSPLEEDKRPRGRPATRGNSATRGGIAGTLPKNVFQSRGETKTRGRPAGSNFLKLASDVTKDPKMAPNFHLRRKLELQGRDRAERAPDLSALGGLFNPSDPNPLKPIDISAARKSTSTVSNQLQESAPENNPGGPIAATRDADASTPRTLPSRSLSYTGKKICFFWNEQQKNDRNQGCSNGYQCDYLHEFRMGAPVAPPPPGFVSAPLAPNEAKEVCFWFNRNQKDPRLPPCDKDNCKYLHSYPSPDTPIRPPPPGWIEPSSNSENYGTGKHVCFWYDRSQKIPNLPPCDKGDDCKFLHTYPSRDTPIRPPPPNWVEPYDPRKPDILHEPVRFSDPEKLHDSGTSKPEVCFWWDRGQRDPELPTCNKSPCWFLHEYPSGDFSIRPPPPGFKEFHTFPDARDHLEPEMEVPQLTGSDFAGPEHQVQTTNQSLGRQTSDNIMSTPEPQSRPEWDPDRPYNAICAFYTRNQCRYGDTCRYYHSNDARLPMQPSVSEMRDVQSRTQCIHWLNGRCDSGSRCIYMHGFPAIKSMLIEPKDAEPKAVEPMDSKPMEVEPSIRTEPRVTLPESSLVPPAALYRRKSVKWADQDTHAEPGDISPGLHGEIEMQDRIGMMAMGTGPNDQSNNKNQAASSSRNSERITSTSSIPKKKLSFADYRRKDAIKKLGKRCKNIVFGQAESQPVLLDVGDTGSLSDSSIIDQFCNLDRIVLGQICMAQDFKAHLRSLLMSSIHAGNLLPADSGDQDASKTLNEIVEELILRSSGLLASFQDFAILVFPASKEEWKFLEAQFSFPKDGRLQYLIFQTKFNLSLQSDDGSTIPAAIPVKPYRKTVMKMVHGLEYERLLPQIKAQLKKEVPRNNFFMLFPASASHLSKSIATWIKECRASARLFDSQKPGSWVYFQQEIEAGVVLVHESAAANIHRLPNLFEVLRYKPNFNFWCISDGGSLHPLFPSSQYLPSHTSIGRLTAHRLFPHGGAILLTPSFLISEPQHAYNLIKLFFQKEDASLPGTWKLVCAFNITDYLLDLANSKVEEKNSLEIKHKDDPAKDAILDAERLSFSHCDLRIKLHSTLVKIFESRNILDGHLDASEEYLYELADKTESPLVAIDRSIDPHDEPALTEWFAAWSMQNLDMYRRFVVVGTSRTSSRHAKRLVEIPEEVPINIKSFHGAEPEPKASGLPVSFSFPSKKQKVLAKSREEDAEKHEAMKSALSIAAKLSALSPKNGNANSTTDEQPMDMDAQISDLIATESRSAAANLPQFDGANGDDNDKHIPQLDGADDRPSSADSTSTTRSGIFTDPNSGQRFVPRSVRPNSTSRKEIAIKPGYVPPEDVERYVSPGVAASRSGSRTASLRNSPVPSISSPTVESQSQSFPVESPAQNDPPASQMGSSQDVDVEAGKGKKVEKKYKEVRYEATTSWYERYKESNGGGWEHIFVGGHEEALKRSGLVIPVKR